MEGSHGISPSHMCRWVSGLSQWHKWHGQCLHSGVLQRVFCKWAFHQPATRSTRLSVDRRVNGPQVNLWLIPLQHAACRPGHTHINVYSASVCLCVCVGGTHGYREWGIAAVLTILQSIKVESFFFFFFGSFTHSLLLEVELNTEITVHGDVTYTSHELRFYSLSIGFFIHVKVSIWPEEKISRHGLISLLPSSQRINAFIIDDAFIVTGRAVYERYSRPFWRAVFFTSLTLSLSLSFALCVCTLWISQRCSIIH